MNLFGIDNGITGDSFYGNGNNHNGIPNIIEKGKVIFTDVEAKGKEQGYTRAEKEYKEKFNNLKTIADQIVSLKGRQREKLDVQAEALINRLESLEQQADALVEEISRRYHIPPDDIRGSLGFGSIIWNPTLGDIFYNYKKQKLIEAEQKGYKEAREFYEKAIENLKKEIAGSKAYFDEALRELYSLICDVFEDIAKKEMEIADLIILLQGGQE